MEKFYKKYIGKWQDDGTSTFYGKWSTILFCLVIVPPLLILIITSFVYAVCESLWYGARETYETFRHDSTFTEIPSIWELICVNVKNIITGKYKHEKK